MLSNLKAWAADGVGNAMRRTPAADAVAAASGRDPVSQLHSREFAERAHAAGDAKTRVAQSHAVDSNLQIARRMLMSTDPLSEVRKRDLLGCILSAAQDNREVGDFALRACLKSMVKSDAPDNCVTRGLALQLHARLLQSMPDAKRQSELLAAVHSVSQMLASGIECEVKFALQYIANCWSEELLPAIIGKPGVDKPLGVLGIVIPPATGVAPTDSVKKQALATLTSLLKRYPEQVEEHVTEMDDLVVDVATRYMKGTLALVTCGFVQTAARVRASAGHDSPDRLITLVAEVLTRATASLSSGAKPADFFLASTAARTLAQVCAHRVPADAVQAFQATLNEGILTSSKEAGYGKAVGALAQAVTAICHLPLSDPAVPELHSKATDVTKAIFKKAEATTFSAFRSPANIKYEALRCVELLQRYRNEVSLSFRTQIVECLTGPDQSLRMKAADVLINSTTGDNIIFVVEQLRAIVAASPDDAVRAKYATKVAELLEQHAAPQTYAKQMLEVLKAAGDAAPTTLSAAIMRAVAASYDEAVQRGTAATFFAQMQEGGALSEAQLLVALWAVAEYGVRYNIAPVQSVTIAIIQLNATHRLSIDVQRQVALSMLKLVSRVSDGGARSALSEVMRDYLRVGIKAQDAVISRLAKTMQQMLEPEPGRSGVALEILNADAGLEGAVSLTALQQLADEQMSQGAQSYVPLEQRDLYDAPVLAPAPALRTAQYDAPRPAATAPLPSAASNYEAATPPTNGATSSPTPAEASGGRRGRARPQVQARLGTFGAMMGAPPAPGGSQGASATSTAHGADLLGGADLIGGDAGADAGQSAGLIDQLFGGSAPSAKPAARRSPPTPDPAAAPMLDLLGGEPEPYAPGASSDPFGGMTDAPAADAPAAAAPEASADPHGLDDLFGAPSVSSAAPQQVEAPVPPPNAHHEHNAAVGGSVDLIGGDPFGAPMAPAQAADLFGVPPGPGPGPASLDPMANLSLGGPSTPPPAQQQQQQPSYQDQHMGAEQQFFGDPGAAHSSPPQASQASKSSPQGKLGGKPAPSKDPFSDLLL